MRSLFAGMVMLSVSMAVVGAAHPQTHPQRPPGYGSMQVRTGHRQPTQDDLQPTQDDLEKIDKDNHELDLPASQDDVTGAGPAPPTEDALTKRIEQDNPRLDREIIDICPSCGGGADPPRVHQRRWPIHNGFNHRPTQGGLKTLHRRDVTPAQARETELYDQLMSSSNRILRGDHARAP